MKNAELQNVKLSAIDNAREGITISDARLPDNPLIYVNKGFSTMTGYSSEEAVGKNCRFLQGPERNQEGVKKISQAISNKQSIQQEIINYKKDGTIFWNKLYITPFFDEANELTHFIGIQEDVTIQKEKEALELKVTSQALINETTLTAEEKHRKEIGKELHDNVNQLLATLKLYLTMAINEEDIRVAMLKEGQATLAIAMEEIRKMSKSLVGPDIKEETLQEAIAKLIYSVQIGVPFTIEFIYNEAIEKNLTQSRKLMFYRIIQEQLNNIIKYAKPTAVTIQFLQQEGNIYLSVKDDGIGFDTTATLGGIGLKNMKNRAEMENGSLLITSAKNRGCEIRVVLPVGDH